MITLILSYIGIYIGVYLARNSPEELVFAEKYFRFLRKIIIISSISLFIFLFTAHLLISLSIITLSIFTYSLLLMLRDRKKHTTNIYLTYTKMLQCVDKYEFYIIPVAFFFTTIVKMSEVTTYYFISLSTMYLILKGSSLTREIYYEHGVLHGTVKKGSDYSDLILLPVVKSLSKNSKKRMEISTNSVYLDRDTIYEKIHSNKTLLKKLSFKELSKEITKKTKMYLVSLLISTILSFVFLL